MKDKDLIKPIPEKSAVWILWHKAIKHKYLITVCAFVIWMTFFEEASWLLIYDLNREIDKYEAQAEYYKNEYEKNKNTYKKLTMDKDEKEKFARENYFMKRKNEEIFIIVTDTSKVK